MQNRFTEGDDLIWTHGSQTIRYGVQLSRLQTNTYMPFRIGSTWSFQGLAQFLAGTPTVLSYVPIAQPNGQLSYANRDFRDTELFPYFNDDWKVSPKLTINLGLRWEFISNPVDQHNDLYAITNFSTSTGFTHVAHAMRENPTWKNFNPRVGFAFDPFSDHKTSIRGGFGLFRDLILPPAYAPAYWDQPPFSTFQAGLGVGGAPCRSTPTSRPPLKPLLTSSPGFDWNTVTTTPYVMQYNLNVQREIMASTLLTVGYVGSRGVHLFSQVEQNPVLPNAAGLFGTLNAAGNSVVDNPRLNTALASFPDLTPTTLSRYNSLQVSLNRRFSRNVQFQVSYTYSRSIDDGAFLGSFNSNVSAELGQPVQPGLRQEREQFRHCTCLACQCTGCASIPRQSPGGRVADIRNRYRDFRPARSRFWTELMPAASAAALLHVPTSIPTSRAMFFPRPRLNGSIRQLSFLLRSARSATWDEILCVARTSTTPTSLC